MTIDPFKVLEITLVNFEESWLDGRLLWEMHFN